MLLAGVGGVSQNLNTKFVLSKSLHTIIEVHYVEIESKINFPGVVGGVGGWRNWK